MGEAFQNLRAQGKSVVVEREENIVIERSDHNIIKRKQTIVREKFLNDANKLHAARQDISDKKHKRQRKQRSRLVPPHSVLDLVALRQDIDYEIAKLKRAAGRHSFKSANDAAIKQMNMKKNVAIQNDMTWDQNLSPKNVEYTFEKYSSQHKIKQRPNRHDEQTSCRPRMRTIGLQKNTQRSDKKAFCLDSAPAIPAAFACFEYEPNGALTDYYSSKNTVHNSNNMHSGCRKYCQHYNMSGNYNGVLCNQNTYMETGVSPCRNYNYCCDEYYYDCAAQQQRLQNSYQQQSVCGCKQLSHQCSCNGGTGDHCHRHHQQQHHHHQASHRTNHRRCSDLNTDEFYARKKSAVDDKTPRRRSRSRHKEEKLTKKQLAAIAERQKQLELAETNALMDREKCRTKRRSKSKSRDVDGAADTHHREQSAAKLAAYLTLSNSDTLLDKAKMLEITKKKMKLKELCRKFDECNSSSMAPDDCDQETLRTLEKMRITAYKPQKRSQKSAKSEDESANSPHKGVKKETQYNKYINQYKRVPEEAATSIKHGTSGEGVSDGLELTDKTITDFNRPVEPKTSGLAAAYAIPAEDIISEYRRESSIIISGKTAATSPHPSSPRSSLAQGVKNLQQGWQDSQKTDIEQSTAGTSAEGVKQDYGRPFKPPTVAADTYREDGSKSPLKQDHLKNVQREPSTPLRRIAREDINKNDSQSRDTTRGQTHENMQEQTDRSKRSHEKRNSKVESYPETEAYNARQPQSSKEQVDRSKRSHEKRISKVESYPETEAYNARQPHSPKEQVDRSKRSHETRNDRTDEIESCPEDDEDWNARKPRSPISARDRPIRDERATTRGSRSQPTNEAPQAQVDRSNRSQEARADRTNAIESEGDNEDWSARQRHSKISARDRLVRDERATISGSRENVGRILTGGESRHNPYDYKRLQEAEDCLPNNPEEKQQSLRERYATQAPVCYPEKPSVNQFSNHPHNYKCKERKVIYCDNQDNNYRPQENRPVDVRYCDNVSTQHWGNQDRSYRPQPNKTRDRDNVTTQHCDKQDYSYHPHDMRYSNNVVAQHGTSDRGVPQESDYNCPTSSKDEHAGFRPSNSVKTSRPMSLSGLPENPQSNKYPEYAIEPDAQFCENVLEEGVVYRDGKDVRYRIRRASDQQYTNDTHNYAREEKTEMQGLANTNGYAQTSNMLQDNMDLEERVPNQSSTSGTCSSAYASASSYNSLLCGTNNTTNNANNSCSCRRQRMRSQIPEFTGCPCMLDTYCSIIAMLNKDQTNNRAVIDDNFIESH